jgi:hypothetical protein
MNDNLLTLYRGKLITEYTKKELIDILHIEHEKYNRQSEELTKLRIEQIKSYKFKPTPPPSLPGHRHQPSATGHIHTAISWMKMRKEELEKEIKNG